MNDNDLKPDALEVLMEAMMTGDTSQAIMNQEKRGQMKQSELETLPKDMLHGTAREQFMALGFIFREDADDLFVRVEFPTGWKKVPTDHSMHTDLVDPQDRVRGGIFYKAAFYDRSAHVVLQRRYTYSTEPINGYGKDYDREDRREVGCVKDCGVRVWQTDPVKIERGEYGTSEKLREEARVWIDENYPDHENVLSYWD